MTVLHLADAALPELLPNLPSRAQIDRLEACVLEAEQQGHAVRIDDWHTFADGLVARTILIPAGTVLTGAVHKAEHLNVCHGDISVWTEQGMRRLTGYHVLSSLPGAKRVGLAFADTWWTTIHLNPDNKRDIAELEDALVEDAHRLQNRRELAALPPVLPNGLLAVLIDALPGVAP